MNLQITGRHLEITPSLKSYVEEKFLKLSKHFDKIIRTEVILNIEGIVHKAEAIISIPGPDIIAKAEGQSMYEAIDLLQDKLTRQINKVSDKKSNHR